MAARKQNGTKAQNDVKREHIKVDPLELRKVRIVNFNDLVSLMGSEGAELFARKVAECVLTGKRRAVGIPKSLRGQVEFPEFNLTVEWEHNGTRGTVLVYSGGGDWAYVGEGSGGKLVSIFTGMQQHGFLVPKRR